MFSCQEKKKRRADVNIVSVILIFNVVGNTKYFREFTGGASHSI